MPNYCQYSRDKSGFFSTHYYCIASGEEKEVNSNFYDYCIKYCTDCPIYKEHHGNSSPCFITTITCKILHKEDNDEVMEELRKFRNNILQQDEKYFDILKEYDTIGPIISDMLINDAKKDETATNIYNNALVPIASLIKEGKNEEAIISYKSMVLKLIDFYDLKETYDDIKNNNYYYEDGEFDSKTAGHGKKLTIN